MFPNAFIKKGMFTFLGKLKRNSQPPAGGVRAKVLGRLCRAVDARHPRERRHIAAYQATDWNG